MFGRGLPVALQNSSRLWVSFTVAFLATKSSDGGTERYLFNLKVNFLGKASLTVIKCHALFFSLINEPMN